MLKYLECPDLHFYGEWMDTSRVIMRAIIKAARDNAVDFVAFPGDLYDRAIYATDKGGINEIISFITELTEICPAVAVYGTPSHDYKGSLDALTKAGLKIIRAGEAWGLYGNTIQPIGNTPRALIFGIQEPTKEWYQSMHPESSAEESNAAIVEAVSDIVARYIAPMRSAHPSIPAVGMFHGNVTDASHKSLDSDIILRSSDVVISTDALAVAGLDRWSLGHIHTPWESSKISAGYAGFAGIDRNPWGKTGFFPAMNLVEIDGEVSITRIPYGTPRREKIEHPGDATDGNVAYWLETEDRDAALPSGVHPWSRVTYKPVETVTRRVDATSFAEAKTLTDLVKMFDPSATDSVLACVSEVEQTIKKPILESRDVRVSRVAVTGATFWGEDSRAEINIDSLGNGITQIVGANGSGKSSLVGFCTPYPVFMGKDTDSGRVSAIKDFFIGQDSKIEKTVFLNGIEHQHLITIRGAHTKTPKTECFLSVSGLPVLEKATFDEMLAECESRYGPMADYLMTTFYVQPLQGKAESGLMTANLTTLRDLVQGIAGIDYTREREYSLARVKTIGDEIERERIQLAAERAALPDTEDLAAKAESAAVAARDIDSAIPAIEAEITALEAEEKESREVVRLIEEIKGLTARRAALQDSVKAAPSVRAALEHDETVKASYSEAVERRAAVVEREAKRSARLAEISAEIAKGKQLLAEEYNAKYRAWLTAKGDRDKIESQNNAARSEIAIIRKPCPECGYIDKNVEDRIRELESSILEVPALPAEPIMTEYAPPVAIEAERVALTAAAETLPVLPSRGLDVAEFSKFRAIIEESIRAESEVVNLSREIEEKSRALPFAPPDADAITANLDRARIRLTAAHVNISRLRAEISHAEEQIREAAVRIADLEARGKANQARADSLESWKSAAAIFLPAKLPAMELETFLEMIDGEASDCVKPYQEGRFSFRTVTQKGDVDKFDILVRDNEVASERSFLKYSVGQKSFLADAYTKALVKVRRDRMKTEYSPIIFDEADSFVDIPSLPVYYEIQSAYYGRCDSVVLVVTHSPDAGNYIQKKVNMKEVVR